VSLSLAAVLSADVSSADISPHFNAVYEFLAEAERLQQPVLVHCGAGVSRSACLVMMYLMRSKRWSAQQARRHCIAARSLVCPNDGFWRLLCALEGPLGILERCG
jgi:dual specificity MAP kinase phosphatase